MIYALLLLAAWLLGVFAIVKAFALTIYRFSEARKNRFLRMFSGMTQRQKTLYCAVCALIITALYLATDVCLTGILQGNALFWNVPVKLLCGCGVGAIVFFLYKMFVLPMHIKICEGLQNE